MNLSNIGTETYDKYEINFRLFIIKKMYECAHSERNNEIKWKKKKKKYNYNYTLWKMQSSLPELGYHIWVT